MQKVECSVGNGLYCAGSSFLDGDPGTLTVLLHAVYVGTGTWGWEPAEGRSSSAGSSRLNNNVEGWVKVRQGDGSFGGSCTNL